MDARLKQLAEDASVAFGEAFASTVTFCCHVQEDASTTFWSRYYIDLLNDSFFADDRPSIARKLGNLAKTSSKARDEITSYNGILPLMRLLRYGDDEGKQWAAYALAYTTLDNENNAATLAEEGAIEPLVGLLSGTDGQKEFAARALWSLAKDNNANREAITKAGAIKLLVDLLQDGTDSHVETTVRTSFMKEPFRLLWVY
ncbi:hypothetical protein ON010_g18608 [Phytophthora cinnamomi]|nr:hypothetical protein ON010_g18608 [Phytophthora cinnamomi]